MSVYRDCYGRTHRQDKNRDWRRAHVQGAHNMVLKGDKKPSDFKGRLREILLKVFRP